MEPNLYILGLLDIVEFFRTDMSPIDRDFIDDVHRRGSRTRVSTAWSAKWVSRLVASRSTARPHSSQSKHHELAFSTAGTSSQ